MATIDRDLVRAINSGNCFVLIGSGPSCEIGLPSWNELVDKTLNNFRSHLEKAKFEDVKKLIRNREYSKAFDELSQHVKLKEILSFIDSLLVIKNKNGKIYNYLIDFPFSCYLTTNFDNALEIYSKRNGLSLLKKGNTALDFKYIRHNSKDLIFKIHGDTSDEKSIVLTEKQYLSFQNDTNKDYWRTKILSVLNMVDLVILGYSVSDPDFKDQLERAKKIASPDHPIFMFATGIKPEEMREFYLKYNIRIISYKNESGTHQELIKMLNRYNPFIAKRSSGNIGLKEVNEDEVTKAASMYLFTQLRLSDESEMYIIKIYSSLILQLLYKKFLNTQVSIRSLKDLIEKEKYFNSNIDIQALTKALQYLYESGYIDLREEKILLIENGIQANERISDDRNLLKEKFLNACNLFLENNFPELERRQFDAITTNLREGLIRAFEKRGIEIARSIYKNTQLDISDNIDILDLINLSGQNLKQNERMAYADLMIEILLNPTSIMKEYLSVLTQGYFSYHALGLDSACYNDRLQLANKSKWIVDSSILLPFFALDCNNHEYAIDLIGRIQKSGLSCITTESLLSEVVEHANWAFNHIVRLEKSRVEMLQVSLGSPGYKQNLFISGYMKWEKNEGNPNFSNYMKNCVGIGSAAKLKDSIRTSLTNHNIEVIDFEKIPELTNEIIERKEILSKEIEVIRRKNGSFRSIDQCAAESEVILLNELFDTSFISQSVHLNRVSAKKGLVTWTPEAMYRFLTLLSNVTPTTNLIYECMTQDFFYSGFNIVDKDSIASFVSPMIKQSRMELSQEMKNYEDVIGKKRFDEIIDRFEDRPDEVKPFYSVQMAFYLAREGVIESKMLKDKIQQMDKVKDLSDKERQEYIKLKKKAFEKKKKALKSKRASQSRKSKKSKKKNKKKKR